MRKPETYSVKRPVLLFAAYTVVTFGITLVQTQSLIASLKYLAFAIVLFALGTLLLAIQGFVYRRRENKMRETLRQLRGVE